MYYKLLKNIFTSLILAVLLTACGSSGGDTDVGAYAVAAQTSSENKEAESAAKSTAEEDQDSNNDSAVEKTLSYKLISEDKLYTYEGHYDYYDLSDFDLDVIKSESKIDDRWGDFTLQLSQEKELSSDISSLERFDKNYNTYEEINMNELVSSFQENLEKLGELKIVFTIGSLDNESDNAEEDETVIVVSSYFDVNVKITAQTESYDENGSINSSYKDDGYYQTGMPSMYSSSSDIVSDRLTNKMWQDTKNVETDMRNNADAQAMCEELRLGDYNDWRLPTVNELQSIVEYSTKNPAIDGSFSHTATSYHWSSSVSPNDDTLGFMVDFYSGNIGLKNLELDKLYVRCIRDTK